MLEIPLIAINSANTWSKILTKTLNLALIYGHSKGVVPSLNQQKKSIKKKVTMSNEASGKSNAVGTPSTSGSANFDCTSTPAVSQQETRIDVNNMMMNSLMNPFLSLQANSALNCCPANFTFYNDFHMQEYLTRYYYHTYETIERNSRNVENAKDRELLSKRTWETTSKKTSKPGFIFTLMSYNILAQDLLEQHPHLYMYHNRKCLDWNTRWNNLYKEIKKASPDVLCLQEVQQSHISNYFSLLEALGYKGLYKRRTGLRSEGCALYYKSDVLTLVEYTTVEFYQPNITILNRDNVAIVAKFKPKLHPTREFVVATTHLLYNPKRQDVRLAQMQVLMAEIERISYNKQNGDTYLPVIITGDLNSTPYSAVYDFITKGSLAYEALSPKSLTKVVNGHMGKVLIPPDLRITDNCQHADLLNKRVKNGGTSRTEELSLIELANSDKQVEKSHKEVVDDSESFCTGTLSHTFSFGSVYDHGHETNEEGTTFQDRWITVDYIFYSGKKEETNKEDKLKLLARYRLPTRSELQGIKIPNTVLGSDHLSLMAKFKLEY